MRKYYIFIFQIIIFSCFSQNQESYQKYLSNFPKAPLTPNTYNFLKQGEVKIDEYTGSNHYEIELYNLKNNDIEIPITLKYTSSNGIKVTEEASWVGLGWNLTLPTIVQMVNDFDDLSVERRFIRPDYFKTYTPFVSDQQNIINDLSFYNYTNSSITSPIIAPEIQNGVKKSFYELSFYNGVSQRKEDIVNYVYDSEPDYFIVNLPGQQLKMTTVTDLYSPNDVLGIVKFKILNNLTYKAEKTAMGIKITDDKGNLYFFEEKEEVFNTDGTGTQFITNRNWFLTKIQNYNNQLITLNYDDKGDINHITQIAQRQNKNTGMNFDQGFTPFYYSILNYLSVNGNSFFNMDLDKLILTSNGIVTNTAKSLNITKGHKVISNIIFDSGKIEFNTSTRSDNNFFKLDNIYVKDLNNTLVKQIKFNYDYFLSANNPVSSKYNIVFYWTLFNEAHLKNRLKLTSVNTYEEKDYVFEYEQNLLPEKNSFARDYWGYANGKLTNTSLLPNMADIYPGFNDLGFVTLNNMNPDISYCKANILKKVIYPSGGSVEFDYELNSATNFFFDIVFDQTLRYGNGLRLKKKILNDDKGNLITEQLFYEDGKALLPKRLTRSNNQYKYGSVPNAYATSCNPPDWCSSQLFTIAYNALSNDSFISSDGFNFSDNVGYSRVTRKIIDNINNGAIEKEFYNKPLTPWFCSENFTLPSLYDSNTNNQNGNILKETFKNDLNITLKEITYMYNFYTSDIEYGIKLKSLGVKSIPYGMTISSGQYYDRSRCDYYCYINPNHFISCYLLGAYPIYAYDSKLSSVKEVLYLNGNPIENLTTFSYSPRRYLKMETKFNSDDVTESTTYIYSHENLSEPYMYEYSFINNVMGETVKELTTKNGQHIKTFNKSYEKNGITNNKIKPVNFFIQKDQNDIQNIAIINKYDNIGNILEFSQNNSPSIVMIYGYNKSLPIAKIENATYAQVQQYEANLQALSNGTDENALSTALNNLRSALPNAMVSTYTHKPLIGISTATDPKGDKQTYHYDSFNRLQFVKDKEGNILSENEYHYKN